MSRIVPRSLFLVALLAGVLGIAAPAMGADTPFSQRYAQTMRGSIEAVGNQLLTCPTATAGCTNAQNRTGSTATMNNNYNMGYVDVDGDGTTVNSSSAALTLPAGATVTWAGLYWGADTSGETAALNAPNAANRGTVKFKVGAGAYQNVTANAADIISSTGKATRYRAFANVTSLVTGNNTFTAADIQTGRGDDRFAGWSLVVAYQDGTQNVHRVSVYDGLGTVDATHTFSTNIAPFYTPASGTVATKTGLLAFEGDAGLQTEVATFNGNPLTDSLNTLNNLENSSMTVDGVYIPGRTPSYNNTQGTDIDVFNSTGLLANHQSSATLAFSSTQDLFVPSALWLVSDEGPASNTSGPTIGGLARDGSTVTANPGSWDGTPTINYQYQWQRCDASGNNCVDIGGATGSTYTLGPADVGSTVRVLVTAVNDAGSSSPASSPPTSTVTMLPPSNVTLPALSGTVQDGQTLTTTIGGWNGTAPLDYDVQWQRCDSAGNNCQDIAGATAWSYVLTGADVGARIRSAVTASNAAGFATANSAPTVSVASAPPVNTVLPVVSGVVRDGQTLTSDTGTWTGTTPMTFGRQWRRCDADGTNCVNIPGATGVSYVLTSADIGHAVRVRVTATNVAGNANASSVPTGSVVADPPTNVVAPSLSGDEVDGGTLTLDRGTWTGTATISYSYVWQRCDTAGGNCAAIPGESGLTYTLTTGDLDGTIRALVTASNTAGVAAEQTAPTGVIGEEAPINVVAPVVTGTQIEGETLTVGPGTWTGTDPIVYTYQWQRCDPLGNICFDIFGATGTTYTLTGDDVDAVVRVLVTGANDAGFAVAITAVTPPVGHMPPDNVTVPVIVGSPTSGQLLTSHDGDWTGSQPLTATYQWERCDTNGANCVDIAGETNSSYWVTDDDAEHTLRIEVTYTNPAGSDTAHSAPTGVVDGQAPTNVTLPSVTGDPTDGQTLSLDDGDWAGTPTLVPSYQWQRCNASGNGCADIAGETAVSYVLRGADVDATVRAVVTYTNDWGQASEATAPSAVVAATPPVVTVNPSVVGTATDGQTVTADPGVWAGTAPVDLTYQWLRCDTDGTNCAPIPGATADEYTLTGADTEHGIRVEVTATNEAGTATATSPVAAVDAAAPQNTAFPTVSGAHVDGSTLTAGDGSWSGTDPIGYDHQWLRCDANGSNCVAIPGETGSSYTLSSDDIGHDVRVSVSATNVAGTAQATSAPSGQAVAADPPANTLAPSVSGTLEDGATLIAGNGAWDGTQPIAFDYQWQRCDASGANCADIAGATGATYTLTAADVGGSVRVEVTGTNGAGEDVATSAPTATVAASAPVSTTPPSIAGTTVDGQTLTADTGSFSGTGPFDFDYQWQRCDADGTHCADIAGATGSTYDLVSADVGGAIVVVVTATNDAGSAPVASAASGEVLPLAPANVNPPSISGDAVEGETLTADPGTWTGTDPIDYGYQWQRCEADGTNCTDILGADDQTYTVTPGDIDHVLQVIVTAGNTGGSVDSGSAQTAQAEADPPSNTVVPVVTGTLEDGETLSATTGGWDGTAPITYAYQWQRCDADGTHCADIAGATSSTYDLTGADAGHAIVVEVTATNAAGDDVATSVPGGSVAVDPPAVTGDPEATGTPVDGEKLTADPGTWTGTGPIEFTYQWQRCDAAGATCVDIAGATDETYTLGSDDVDSTVRVVVTADNGETTTVASPTVGPVVAAPPVSVSVPTVSGTAGAGHTLTAGDGTWSGSTPMDFDYQWQRCAADGTNCVDIAGETGSTYDLTDADAGHAVRVEVTASNTAGDDVAASAPTASVLPAPPGAGAQPTTPSGTPVDGGTLTADPGTWTGEPPTDIDYQWQSCDADGTHCVDIPGATGDTYSPTGDDAGHAIVVVVTATNAGGSTSQASEPTDPIADAPPVNVTPPSITGTPEDGGTLTADPGTWSGTAPIDYEYQWQRCEADGTHCADIPGATGSTYSPTGDDIGSVITVVVTASNDGGDAEEAAGAPTDVIEAVAPNDTVAPSVSGDPVTGPLTADVGTWTGTTPVDYEYQWQRCDANGANCVDIVGSTGDEYTPTADDQGHVVLVVVTATNLAGTDIAASEGVLVPAPPVNVAPPTISGDEEVGSTLTADPGTWEGTGPLDYDYQWQRCDADGTNCVDIVGATDDEYVLTGGDLGHVIVVVVSASNAAGSASEDAPASAEVTAADPGPTPTPTPTPTPSTTPTPTPTQPTKPSQPATPSTPGAPVGPATSDSAFGGLGGGDLGDVPGSLVGDASCQQLAGNSKYRRVKAKGIGTVRVRAYSTGPATQISPVLVTTQISHGKAKKVTYKLDGKRLKAKKRGWKSAITPRKLQKVGMHKLVALVQGKKKKAKKLVTLKLKTVTCRTLFTAQRWKTTAGAGLRLRVDARTAMQKISFKVPAPLLPRQARKARTVGFMRVFVAGERGRRRFALKLAKKGKKTPMVAGAGKPTVTFRKGKIDVAGLPPSSAVTELTIYRVKKLDGATKRRVYKLRARVAPTGGSLSVRPKAPR